MQHEVRQPISSAVAYRSAGCFAKHLRHNGFNCLGNMPSIRAGRSEEDLLPQSDWCAGLIGEFAGQQFVKHDAKA